MSPTDDPNATPKPPGNYSQAADRHPAAFPAEISANKLPHLRLRVLHDKRLAIAVIAVVGLIYLGFALAVYLLRLRIELDPAVFVTEYAKFLGPLTLAVLTYLMANEYLSRRRRTLQSLIFEQRLIISIREVGRLVVETTNLLRDHFVNFVIRANHAAVVDANIAALKECDGRILELLLFFEENYLRNHPVQRFQTYRTDVHPLVDKLATIRGNSPLLKDFFDNGIPVLDTIGVAAHSMLRDLIQAEGGAEQ